MAAVNVYKVIWHIERNGNHKSDIRTDFVGAASADAASITTVLANNNKGCMSGDAVKIDSIAPYHCPAILT